MTINTQPVKDWMAQLMAHLKRAEAMLTFGDNEFDKSVALIQNPPIGPASQFGFVGNTCVVPYAPIGDIIHCLAEGGIVNAVVVVKPIKWPATQAALQSSTAMVRITKCSEFEMSVICDLPGVDVIKNPKQTILWVAMNPVGG